MIIWPRIKIINTGNFADSERTACVFFSKKHLKLSISSILVEVFMKRSAGVYLNSGVLFDFDCFSGCFLLKAISIATS